MTIVNSIISRLARYILLLYSRNWERWEILTIAGIALVLILLVVIARRKKRVTPRRIQNYTPIIGIRLAHRGTRH